MENYGKNGGTASEKRNSQASVEFGYNSDDDDNDESETEVVSLSISTLLEILVLEEFKEFDEDVTDALVKWLAMEIYQHDISISEGQTLFTFAQLRLAQIEVTLLDTTDGRKVRIVEKEREKTKNFETDFKDDYQAKFNRTTSKDTLLEERNSTSLRTSNSDQRLMHKSQIQHSDFKECFLDEYMTDCIAIKTENVLLDEADPTVVFSIKSEKNSGVYNEETDIIALDNKEKEAKTFQRLDVPMQNREANPMVVFPIESVRNSEVYNEKTDLSTIGRPYAEFRCESNGGGPESIG